jgi:hypothetical protein
MASVLAGNSINGTADDGLLIRKLKLKGTSPRAAIFGAVHRDANRHDLDGPHKFFVAFHQQWTQVAPKHRCIRNRNRH